MPKRTPLPCTADNCGDNFLICGKTSTYSHRKCRCESCSSVTAEVRRKHYAKNREAIRADKKRYREANREKVAEGKKRYYEENREKVIESTRRYHAENRETILEKQKQYRLDNLDAIRESQQRWREANREKAAESSRQWRQDNPGRHREYMRDYSSRYQSENREKVNANQKRWRLNNPERARESWRLSSHRRRARIYATQVVDFTPEQLDQKMAYYGHKCYLNLPGLCTGEFDQIEHVKPLSKGGPHLIANMRPSCEPCNSHKRAKWPFKFAA